MVETIIKTVISFLVTGALGYLVARIKEDNRKLKMLKETQLIDMKGDLSNKFFIYDSLELVEDYLVMSFREKCEKYFALGGDSWIHPMYDKSFEWQIKPTGYLK